MAFELSPSPHLKPMTHTCGRYNARVLQKNQRLHCCALRWHIARVNLEHRSIWQEKRNSKGHLSLLRAVSRSPIYRPPKTRWPHFEIEKPISGFWWESAAVWQRSPLPRSAVSHHHSFPHCPTSKSSLPSLTNFFQVGAARLSHIWQAAGVPPVTWGRFYRVDKPRLTHGISLIWSHNPPPVLSDSCPAAFLSPLCSSSITD